MKLTNVTFLFVLLFSSLANAQLLGTDEDLFAFANRDTQVKSEYIIHHDNLRTIRDFVDAEYDTDLDWDDAKYLDPNVAKDVISVMGMNPVVAMWAYSKYDPMNRGIGFCFGRAMFAHIELAYRDLDRDSIKKAFVVGNMSTGDGNSWGWHVTTIAQSKDADGNEVWLAIDPVTGVKTLKNWYKEMYTNFSTDKRLKLYVTSSGRFGPSRDSEYDQNAISVDFYNNYFTDMLNWFGENSGLERYNTPLEEFNP